MIIVMDTPSQKCVFQQLKTFYERAAARK